jgi:integrase
MSIKALSKEELVALLDHCAEPDKTMFRTCFFHGLRISECLSLTAANIKGDYIICDRLKGSNAVEQKLCAGEKEALQKVIDQTPDGGRLFPICRKTAHTRIKKAAAAAGLPAHRVFCHALRHSCGRQFYLSGGTIQEIVIRLGHVNPSNSLRYAEATAEESENAFAKAVAGLAL